MITVIRAGILPDRQGMTLRPPTDAVAARPPTPKRSAGRGPRRVKASMTQDLRPSVTGWGSGRISVLGGMIVPSVGVPQSAPATARNGTE